MDKEFMPARESLFNDDIEAMTEEKQDFFA